MDVMVTNAKKVFQNNFALQSYESVLVVTDDEMEEVAAPFYAAAKEVSGEVVLIKMPAIYRSGEEPPSMVATAMAKAAIVLCITQASLTHTQARKKASENGSRVGTMPGITMDMLRAGAITADMEEVVALTAAFTEKLTETAAVTIKKGGHCLDFSIAGRKGIASTGIFHHKGESGNIPSGESYIAPIENSANGQLLVDGSIAGIGKVTEPVLLTIKEGRLVAATGEIGAHLLEILGEGNGRIIAEFGIGTNTAARITGVVLEDEKVFSTVHIAFGSNKPFGGTTEAGVHIDCVVTEPTVYLDGTQLKLEKSQKQL